MTILWRCSCGTRLTDAHQAFLHRDGSDHHKVEPLLLASDATLEATHTKKEN